MARKRKSSREETLQAALTYPADLSQGRTAEHREIILVLAHKRIAHRAIAAFLKERGIRIHQTSISYYLRTHPPTDAEVARIKEMLAAKPTVRRDQEPGREIRQLPAHPKSSQQQDAETPEDAARRQRREEMLARARKNCPPPQPEEEDTTDYSFLDVQGRPFRIKPDA